MLDGIEVLCHSSIKINKSLIIYFDPFKIKKFYNDADIIFITHSHYDHYSPEDINKVIKDNTIIVIPEDLKEKVSELGIKKENLIAVKPNEEHNILGISFKAIPAYNVNKTFHPKVNDWLGYIVNISNIIYYIAGDTDITKENKQVKCDVAFVPVGGTYTMTYNEAAELVNKIKPKFAIPIHYGSIVGSQNDAINFSKQLDKNIICQIITNSCN